VNPPSGCVFHTRCPLYRTLGEGEQERCRTEAPALEAKIPGQYVSCHFAQIRTDVIAGDEEAEPQNADPRLVGAENTAGGAIARPSASAPPPPTGDPASGIAEYPRIADRSADSGRD
jgi:hypothetical protein